MDGESDGSFNDFLGALQGYQSTVPEELVSYLLRTTGVDTEGAVVDGGSVGGSGVEEAKGSANGTVAPESAGGAAGGGGAGPGERAQQNEVKLVRRVVALAADKFIADLVNDAVQYNRILHGSDDVELTMDDARRGLAKVGVHMHDVTREADG